MWFLKIILIILLVYYGLKILANIFGPSLLRYVSKRTEKHFADKFRQYNDQKTSYEERSEGEVSIDKQPESERKSNRKVGEYIDFEEID